MPDMTDATPYKSHYHDNDHDNDEEMIHGNTNMNTNMIYSRIVPYTSRKGIRGNIHRHYDGHNNNTTTNNDSIIQDTRLTLYGCSTCYEVIRYGANINPFGSCLGYRTVSSNTGFATPYIYISYTETLSRIHSFAAGLYVKDCILPNDNNLLLLGIYIPNCIEWILSEHAAYTLGAATVPFYDTLGHDIVLYILHHTRLSCVVISSKQTSSIYEAFMNNKDNNNNQVLSLKYIIVIDGITSDMIQQIKEVLPNVILYSFAHIEAIGAEYIATCNTTNNNRSQYHYHKPPNPNDIATFCYTSGTTGLPKAAMLTHCNLISAATGTVNHVLGDGVSAANTIYDRHLSYLPLPHIFERVVQITILVAGASIAFYRNKPEYLIEDIIACQPTILPVVPRVLNKIYDQIHYGINEVGGIKKKVFDYAVKVKRYNLLQYGQLYHTLYDKILFNKIKTKLGLSSLRFMLSGSAPLSTDVMIFFRILLGIPVVEGYGQTEGAAAATISHPLDQTTVGHVGGPTPAVEIALYDVPDMGYYHTDRYHGTDSIASNSIHDDKNNKNNTNTNNMIPCYGRGEICIRGPNVFIGYYKDIEKTNEMIDNEGWLHSGDIGIWNIDGTLQIIDRKKNLLKLSQGEYVAPEKIENIISRSKYIGQCYVHGDSYQNYLIAIIVPDDDVARSWWNINRNSNKNNDNTSYTLAKACNDNEFYSIVLNDIHDISKVNHLNKLEIVQKIYLSYEHFTIENDLITPTFKLKRQNARQYYANIIQQLYHNNDNSKQEKQQSSLTSQQQSKL